jgi:hypothetical protein
MPVASDLREGKATMAIIHALERCTPAERKQIETVLIDRAFNGVTHADILAILNRYGSLEYASQEAARYAESARKAICVFPDSEIKRALLWAPDFVVAREMIEVAAVSVDDFKPTPSCLSLLQFHDLESPRASNAEPETLARANDLRELL